MYIRIAQNLFAALPLHTLEAPQAHDQMPTQNWGRHLTRQHRRRVQRSNSPKLLGHATPSSTPIPKGGWEKGELETRIVHVGRYDMGMGLLSARGPFSALPHTHPKASQVREQMQAKIGTCT